MRLCQDMLPPKWAERVVRAWPRNRGMRTFVWESVVTFTDKTPAYEDLLYKADRANVAWRPLADACLVNQPYVTSREIEARPEYAPVVRAVYDRVFGGHVDRP